MEWWGKKGAAASILLGVALTLVVFLFPPLAGRSIQKHQTDPSQPPTFRWYQPNRGIVFSLEDETVDWRRLPMELATWWIVVGCGVTFSLLCRPRTLSRTPVAGAGEWWGAKGIVASVLMGCVLTLVVFLFPPLAGRMAQDASPWTDEKGTFHWRDPKPGRPLVWYQPQRDIVFSLEERVDWRRLPMELVVCWLVAGCGMAAVLLCRPSSRESRELAKSQRSSPKAGWVVGEVCPPITPETKKEREEA